MMTGKQMRRMADKMPENSGKFDQEIARCLYNGADAIELLERALRVERAVNERLREIKSPPRANWTLRAAVVMGALLMFSVAWPLLQYVFNPSAGASW